jgi:hypothetical protein
MLSIRTRAWSVVSTGVLPRLMTCVGAWRVAPAGDEPIEQHADGGEVLLDRRLRHSLLERLYIGGDVDGLDIDQHQDTGGTEPGEEVRDGPIIGHPGVLVADGGGKKFQEAAGGGVAGGGDDRRHRDAGADRSYRF